MHIKAVKMVEKIPMMRPEHMKANGMPRIPVPKEALSKCVRVSLSLQGNKHVLINVEFKNH